MNYKKIILIIMFILINNSLFSVVIGEDSRKQIDKIENQYARKVGQIEVWNNNENYRGYCTATNLNRKYIITSAHCIIDESTNKPFENIVYYPKRLNLEDKFPSRVYIKTGYLMKGYEISGKKLNKNKKEGEISIEMISEDIAILEAYSELENSYVGDIYGYYKHDYKTLSEDDNLKVMISSYPSDKEFSTLWHEVCRLNKSFANIGLVNCDLMKGASGSAVIYENKIIGIFSAEDPINNENNVTLITHEMEKEINNVVIGEHHINKMLKKVEFKTESYNYFYFYNKCNKAINGAVRIEDENKIWSIYLMENVLPKRRSLSTPENKSTEYYYYAETIGKDKEWQGQDYYDYISELGQKKGFKKAKANNNKTGKSFGDWYIDLRCY
jgi:V8-like Glu-specific endopeptidase